MHQIAVRVANASVARNWIREQDRLWCIYAVESKLIQMCFFLVLLPLSTMLKIIPQVASFSIVFLMLRRRLGGWHAPYFWLCQIISVALVVSVALFVGPILTRIPELLLWGLDFAIMLFALRRQPVYPKQVHFDIGIAVANNKKKNFILLSVLVVQICSIRIYKPFLIYSFLAVLTGVAAVYIELLHQSLTERRSIHENR